MAVQKSRVTRSRTGKRRAHDSLKKPNLCEDAVTGGLHQRHHMTADGFYRGVQYVEVKEKAPPEDTEAEAEA